MRRWATRRRWRSRPTEDNRRGGAAAPAGDRDHTDIRVLENTVCVPCEQQRFGEAVAAEEMMLKLLPALTPSGQ